MYDAIIVGARCAGAPTAMLLARSGHNVLLLDKSTFPSDIMSTHFIQQPGVEALERWGVLERVRDAGTPPIRKVTFYMGGQPVQPPGAVPDAVTYCPRRTVLDKILVDAAREAGAEVREGFAVQALLRDGAAVTGVRGAMRGENNVEDLQARVTIGADGMHSLVAREVQAPRYNEHPPLTCAYYTYWSGVPMDGAELHLGEDAGVLAFPTNDGMACIAVGRAHDEFAAYRSDYEANYMAHLDRVAPDLARRVRAGKREEKFIGTADVPNFFRQPYGPGWALVGDAGYHKDPITGLGITDAFRDAELLAGALHAVLGGAPWDETMSAYQKTRDEQALPSYNFTVALAMMPAPEALLETATRVGQDFAAQSEAAR